MRRAVDCFEHKQTTRHAVGSTACQQLPQSNGWAPMAA
jgi:hypothetical protein